MSAVGRLAVQCWAREPLPQSFSAQAPAWSPAATELRAPKPQRSCGAGCKCLRNTLLDHSFKRRKQSPHLLVSKLPCQKQVRGPTGVLSNSSKSSPINGPTRSSLLLNACPMQVPGFLSDHFLD
ncbi:uncharacterized protein LOC124906252 isoform X1 [Homo sapiens]|nr:uncharacterized protein LOC124906252 isoform X1 [Homo sapiens]